jgi:pimeloyl-ACP methyl ester carboxylesterase
VPLDPSGRHKGAVRLHFEVLPAAGTGRHKTLFMVAGGPGQPSAETFELDRDATSWQQLFPGYTLVAYDDRGTGKSGKIGCPGLLAIATAGPDLTSSVIGACGRKLGERSSLYSSLDNANDMDAIRSALGVDQIAVYGASYGTKQALSYALAYPDHVSRLVLDSVVAPNWPYPFNSRTLRSLPFALDDLCRDACHGVTTNAGADFARLANRLAADPVVTTFRPAGAKPLAVRLDGYALVELGVETDLDPGLAAELPLAVSVGLRGDFGPLVRLLGVDEQIIRATGSPGIDLAVSVATQCADGRFFWSADTPVADRSGPLERAERAQPAGADGPFGRWANLQGAAQQCERWPAATTDSSLPKGPPPNVPVLILSGGRDVRTPTAVAREVARSFPLSRLLVVPGAGHAVSISSSCADHFIANWLRGLPHKDCPRQPLPMSPIRAFPQLPAGAGATLTATQTLAVAASTLREAEATALVGQGVEFRVGGLAGGSFQWLGGRSLVLRHYSDVEGVTLDGLLLRSSRDKGGWIAVLDVGGSVAAPGQLTLHAGKLSGGLGGSHVDRPADFAG